MDDEGRRATYRDLAQRSSRAAQVLEQRGVRQGALVGVHLDRGVPLVVTIVAIAMLGAAYVPLPIEYPRQRLGYMSADAGIALVVTDTGHYGSVRSWFSGAVALVDSDAVLTCEAPGGAAARCPPPAGMGAEPLACLLYTSGSTGNPKGIGVSTANVAHLVIDCEWVRLSAASVIAQVSNAAFDAMTFELWGALLNGGSLRVITGLPSSIAPKLMRAASDRETLLFLTTSLFNRLARSTPDALRDVTTLLFGGELADRTAVATFVESGYTGRLIHVYGPTEATTFATYWDIDLTALPDDGLLPVGLPLPGVVISVRDANGTPVPSGAEGEVWISGNGVTTGYWHQPELTRQRFTCERGMKTYQTGDLGKIVSVASRDLLVVKGRIDDQFKYRGYRIEPAEIERALRNEIPGEAVVLPIDAPRGPLLTAFLAGAGASIDGSELRRRLSSVLPAFMIPDAFIAVDHLPLLPNGKVDRGALRSLVIERRVSHRP
jgi:amino acid adenylation domain-containing protein